MQNLHCNEFGRLLEAAVESRQPADLRLREHAAECENCRAAWEQYLILEDALRAWTTSTPEADLFEPVLSKLAYHAEDAQCGNPRARTSVVPAQQYGTETESKSQSREKWKRSTVATILAGAAAAVMAIVFLPATIRRSGDATTANFTIPDAANRGDLVAVVTQSPQLEDSELTSAVRDAGVAYIGLANGAAEAVTQGAVFLSPTSTTSDSMPVDESVQPGWVDRVRTEVTPLGERLEGALDFLIDAFPTEPTPTT